MANENSKSTPPDIEGAIYDIKYIGDLLSCADMDHDLEPNTVRGIGHLLTKLADQTIDMLNQGGTS